MVHADVGSFISAAKFPSSLGQVPLFKFWQCEDYSEQSKPYFQPLTFAWQRCVLQREYFDFVWLRFHYNLISLCEEANFTLTVLRDQV